MGRSSSNDSQLTIHNSELLLPALPFPPGPSLPAVRPALIRARRDHAVQPPRLPGLRGFLGRDVFVESAGLRPRDRAVGEPADDELPPATSRHRDRDVVADAQLT